MATDLDRAQPILFQRDDPGVAVRALSKVRTRLQPVNIGERRLVNGGLVSPVPMRFARLMGAELVFGGPISSPPDGQASGDPMHMLHTLAIMGGSIRHFELNCQR